MHHSHIDRYAQQDSFVHRLDARGKLLVVLAYTVVLISFDRYAVAALAPMCVLPLVALWFARVPVWFALRRVLLLCPFILLACALSPVYDRTPHAVAFGPWQFVLAAGWLTAADIALKFALGVIALTALTGTTPFAALLGAMRRFGVPRPLTALLGMVYRYLFLLIDQMMRASRARLFRGGARAPLSRRLRSGAGIVGSLFLRTLERAERVHLAMCARGYGGEIRALRVARFRAADAAVLGIAAAYLVFCRWVYPGMLR